MRIARFWSVVLLMTLSVGPAGAQVFTFIDGYFDGDVQGAMTIDGLNFVWAPAVSPDGEHLYTCGGVNNVASGDEDDNALSVFSRDLMTGALTFVQVLFDDDDDNDPGAADGLLACRDVEVSPDGKHVYTAGSSDAKIGIFSRDGMTGSLTFLSVVQDGIGGVDGLGGVEDLALSPDGSALFAVGRAEDKLAAFTRDAMTGALTFEDLAVNGVAGVTGLDRPLAVALSPDGLDVYVASGSNANFAGSDAITHFSWEEGAMDPLVFVAAYFEGAVQGANTIDGIDQVSDVKVSPDGKHVYAASEVDTIGGASGNGNDWIAIFARAANGSLTWSERIAGFKICPTSPFGADAESFLALGPHGQRVYVVKNWADNGVAAFERNAATGSLTFLEGICELDPSEIGMSLPRKIGIDPLGIDLYVAGNASDAISAVTVCAEGFVVLDLTDSGVVNTTETEEACDSITAGGGGAGYVVGAAGVVTFKAPHIALTSGFEVIGDFTAVND